MPPESTVFFGCLAWALIVWGVHAWRYLRLDKIADPVQRADAMAKKLFCEAGWVYVVALAPAALQFLRFMFFDAELADHRFGEALYYADGLTFPWLLHLILNQALLIRFRKLVSNGPYAPHLRRLRGAILIWAIVVTYSAIGVRTLTKGEFPLVCLAGCALIAYYIGVIVCTRGFGKWAKSQLDLRIPPETQAIWEELCRAAGVKARLAAYFGLNYGRGFMAFAYTGSTVYVTPLFCRGLSLPEQKFVLAHELGHIKLGHVGWRVKSVGLLRAFAIELMVLPIFTFSIAPMISLLVAALGPLVCLSLLQWRNWTSLPTYRKQEFEADAFAARYADATFGAVALEKVLESVGGQVAAQMGAYTHPPLSERVKRLEALPVQVP